MYQNISLQTVTFVLNNYVVVVCDERSREWSLRRDSTLGLQLSQGRIKAVTFIRHEVTRHTWYPWTHAGINSGGIFRCCCCFFSTVTCVTDVPTV